MTLNLADLFDAVADALPDRCCLVCGDERRTYSQLQQRSDQLGYALLETGVAAGDQ